MKKLNNDKSANQGHSQCPSLDLLIDYAFEFNEDTQHISNCTTCSMIMEELKDRIKKNKRHDKSFTRADLLKELEKKEDEFIRLLNNHNYSTHMARETSISLDKSNAVVSSLKDNVDESVNQQDNQIGFFSRVDSFKNWSMKYAAAISIIIVAICGIIIYSSQPDIGSPVSGQGANQSNPEPNANILLEKKDKVLYASVSGFNLDKSDLIFTLNYLRQSYDLLFGDDFPKNNNNSSLIDESFLKEIELVIQGSKSIDQIDQDKLEQCIGKIPELYKIMSAKAKVELMSGEQENPFILKIVEKSNEQIVFQDTISHPPFALFNNSHGILKQEWGNIDQYAVEYKLLRLN